MVTTTATTVARAGEMETLSTKHFKIILLAEWERSFRLFPVLALQAPVATFAVLQGPMTLAERRHLRMAQARVGHHRQALMQKVRFSPLKNQSRDLQVPACFIPETYRRSTLVLDQAIYTLMSPKRRDHPERKRDSRRAFLPTNSIPNKHLPTSPEILAYKLKPQPRHISPRTNGVLSCERKQTLSGNCLCFSPLLLHALDG